MFKGLPKNSKPVLQIRLKQIFSNANKFFSYSPQVKVATKRNNSTSGILSYLSKEFILTSHCHLITAVDSAVDVERVLISTMKQ